MAAVLIHFTAVPGSCTNFQIYLVLFIEELRKALQSRINGLSNLLLFPAVAVGRCCLGRAKEPMSLSTSCCPFSLHFPSNQRYFTEDTSLRVPFSVCLWIYSLWICLSLFEYDDPIYFGGINSRCSWPTVWSNTFFYLFSTNQLV